MSQESKKKRTNINLVGNSSVSAPTPRPKGRKKVAAKSRRRTPAVTTKIQRKSARGRR
tara:strand:+ start:1615 stop:1788 length:174 start_codon:yes stop_codon:yes gene_type:complete